MQEISQMGLLIENKRICCDGMRSGHPAYSSFSFGKYASRIHEMNKISAYSEEAPFAFLAHVEQKLLLWIIGDHRSTAFCHHVEEMSRLIIVIRQNFEAGCADLGESVVTAECEIYVNRIEKGAKTFVNPAGEIPWQKGVDYGDRPRAGSGLRFAFASNLYDVVEEVIASGGAEGMLFKRY